jgi:hypothetical protein
MQSWNASPDDAIGQTSNDSPLNCQRQRAVLGAAASGRNAAAGVERQPRAARVIAIAPVLPQRGGPSQDGRLTFDESITTSGDA